MDLDNVLPSRRPWGRRWSRSLAAAAFLLATTPPCLALGEISAGPCPGGANMELTAITLPPSAPAPNVPRTPQVQPGPTPRPQPPPRPAPSPQPRKKTPVAKRSPVPQPPPPTKPPVVHVPRPTPVPVPPARVRTPPAPAEVEVYTPRPRPSRRPSPVRTRPPRTPRELEEQLEDALEGGGERPSSPPPTGDEAPNPPRSDLGNRIKDLENILEAQRRRRRELDDRLDAMDVPRDIPRPRTDPESGGVLQILPQLIPRGTRYPRRERTPRTPLPDRMRVPRVPETMPVPRTPSINSDSVQPYLR